MRRLFLIAVRALSWRMHAQQIDWTRVDVNIRRLDPTLARARLTAAPNASLRHLLAAKSGDGWQSCGGDSSWICGSSLYVAPIGAPQIVYVVPGSGCIRAGQGSNGGLWLVDMRAATPRLIASPRLKFNGWGLGVQSHVSHGLHDIVTGWHMGASEMPLTYLRYDGGVYRAIGSIDLKTCVPDPSHTGSDRWCLPDGRQAADTAPAE